LRRWAKFAGDEGAAAAADALYGYGQRGVDARRGVVVNKLDDDLRVVDAGARLWPQTEWLKSAAQQAACENDPALLAEVIRAGRAMASYFRPSAPALWWDLQQPDGRFVHAPSPASSLYHLLGAVEALRPWKAGPDANRAR
jgi:mannose-6-phosphate isomerase